jgi:hypothetical protein
MRNSYLQALEKETVIKLEQFMLNAAKSFSGIDNLERL